MKKLFPTSIMVAVALSMTAATSTPQFKWGSLLDGSTAAGDQATALAKSERGGLFGLFTAGTTDDARTVMLNNSPLFTGSPYAGTSYANNFCLIRFANDGSAEWNIHTESGDFASNSGTVAATSDGGCIVMAKVRHTDGYLDLPICFISASGKSHTLDWTPEQRYYRVVIMKVSQDGEIEWINSPEIATSAVNDECKDFVAEGFNLYNGCVDSEDNIYIPLNLREPITFGSETIQPSNVSSWNGDSQKAAGSFLIVKLDKNGNYVGSLGFEGEADATYCQQIVCNDGILYGIGTAAGANALSCQDFTFEPTLQTCPVVLRFTPELKVEWAKCLQGETVNGKYAVQNLSLTADSRNLWICGAFNGKIADGTEYVESVQGSLREGLLISLNAEDGKWLKGVSSRETVFDPAVANTSLTSYMSVLSNPTNASKVWVYGYGMNANVGSFIREYDAETLEGSADGSWNLVTGGGVPTCQAIAYDNKEGICYNSTRGNKAFQPLDGPVSEAPNGWGVYISSFELPEDMRTNVGSISQLDQSLKIKAIKGGIEVVAASQFMIYDLTGRCVYIQHEATTDPVRVLLPEGLYICQSQKILVR